MRNFRRAQRVSTWRRVAASTWNAPGDPSVYGNIDIDATEALAYIAELRARTGLRITLTHLVGRAVALAIRARPEVNSIVRFGSIWQRETVDVFFQVAFEGGENLGGAKIARADEKTVVDIAQELVASAGSVRRGEHQTTRSSAKFSRLPGLVLGAVMKAGAFLSYDLGLNLEALGMPYDGFGSVMVTNVGGFGIQSGLAPLVPFSRCPLLLLVGEVHQRAVVVDGQIVARPMLPIGATFDHRLLDGYGAGVVAKRFREIMEAPSKHLGTLG